MVHFSPLLQWHSALAWQPFMPKKYFVGAKCSSGCTAGLHSKHHSAWAQALVAPPGTGHLLCLFSSCRGKCVTTGGPRFRGDLSAVLPQVPESRFSMTAGPQLRCSAWVWEGDNRDTGCRAITEHSYWAMLETGSTSYSFLGRVFGHLHSTLGLVFPKTTCINTGLRKPAC